MAGTNSQPEFGFDDFRRYRDGEMSAQEQHHLEKRMLEEPLVAEAYEGFLALNEDQIDYPAALENLQEKLGERIKPERPKALPLWAYASAASIILGLGFYWLVFVLNKDTSNKDVAFEMSIERPDQVNAAEEPKLKETQLPPATLKPIPQKALGNVPSTETKPKPAGAPRRLQDAEKRLDTNLEEAIAANDQEHISVVETISASAPAAALSYQAPLRKSPAKVSNDYAAATSLSSRPSPLHGWESYQSYLLKNSVSAEQSGEVEVTFMVNSDSTLSAFSATGDVRFFQKAIRTVQYGPAWIPAKSNGRQIGMPITINIQFRNSN